MKKEIKVFTGFLATSIILWNRKRLISLANREVTRITRLRRTTVLFRVNEKEELAQILFTGLTMEGQGKRTAIVRSNSPFQIIHLTKSQVRKLDGIYKCLCNHTLSEKEIVVRTYATLLELTEEQLENLRDYLF